MRLGIGGGLAIESSGIPDTGGAALVSSGESVSATGTETFSGPIAVASSGEAVASTGTETMSGPVAVTSSGEAVASTGTETISGTAAMTSSGEATAITAGTPPLAQANIQAYYQGDLGITLTGGKVSGWADQSGNGVNLSQATTAKQPVNTDTLNGKAVVTFASGQLMAPASRQTNIHVTVLAVVSTTDTRTTSTYAGDAPNTVLGDNSGGVSYGFGTGSGVIIARNFLGSWTTLSGSGTVNDGGTYLIANVLAGSLAGQWQNYREGVADGSGGAGSTSGQSGWNAIGAGFDSTHDMFNGKMAMVAVVSRALSTNEITQWEKWAQVYWNAA